MIACLDVHYADTQARAACVLLQSWTDAWPASTHIAEVKDVAPYEPGRFYLRELPCLLAVLQSLPQPPATIVVDGYVWLSADREPGLGAHLHAAIQSAATVIGVAKTRFVTLTGSALVDTVYRGSSKNPLYVTSIGIQPKDAGEFVRNMHGNHRIPDALHLVDRLARDTSPMHVR
jgi:deoxyribonuclease V